jgi:ABC-2 type transport system permease protein
MKNLFRLAFVIYKGNGLANFAGDSSRKRKLSRVGSVVLFTFLAAYMIGIVTAASLFFYDVLAPVHLQSLVVSLFLSTGSILVFLFGILYVISIFYYASDVEKLLPLPLKADEIIGAKLLVTAMYEYIYEIVLVAPPLMVYGIRSGAGPLYFLYSLLVLLLLPVVPICLASILSMLIMRFTRFARNKDRFSLFSGLLAMVIALALVFGSQSLTSLSAGDLSGLLSRSAADIARLTSAAFPGVSFAAAALADATGWAAAGRIGLLILIAAAFLAVTMALSRLLYFKGVIGLGSSMASRRRLTEREMADAGTGGHAFWTYVLKDLRVLVRTPIFFMNNVMMNFIWPVFILIPLLGNKGDADLGAIVALLQSSLTIDSPAVPVILASVFAAACFISGTNGIAESALSREGKLLYLMKILPMSYGKQIWAKLTAGILMSVVGTLLLVIVLAVFVHLPLWFLLLILATLPGAVLTTNLAGIIFELYWPKLNWDNEQKAVKQNLNVLYGILLGIVLAALVVVPVTAFGLTLLPTALIVCVVPLLFALILALIIKRIGPRLIAAIDA